MQPMLQPHHVPPARPARTGRRRLSQRLQRGTASTKAREAAKSAAAAESSKSAAATSASAAKRPETNAAASQKSAALHHSDHGKKLHLGTGCGGLKRGNEIFRNECIIKCQ